MRERSTIKRGDTHGDQKRGKDTMSQRTTKVVSQRSRDKQPREIESERTKEREEERERKKKREQEAT